MAAQRRMGRRSGRPAEGTDEDMSIAVEPEATRLSVAVGGREITFETGVVAKQAHGAVLVSQGGTVVLATAVGRTEGRPGADFFPLTVDVEEKMYAAGKIPGGFFKREGRAGEKAILTARMVDRPIRPLWPKGYKNEVQVVVTTFSADQVHGHDILAMNGASAALMLSPLPFLGPVGAVRVGRLDGQLMLNPTLVELKESTLDLVVCGTPDAIFREEAPEITGSSTEADMLERVRVQFAIDELVVEARDNAVYPKVKEQFGDAVRALSDAEQDSKELKLAKRAALLEEIEHSI